MSGPALLRALAMALGLAVGADAVAAMPESATVARDVARVFSAPEGYEIDRLRADTRVGVLGEVDRRRGDVWVRIRRPGGHPGWMRAGDLSPEGGTVRGHATTARPTPADQASPPATDGDWATGAWMPAVEGVEIAIVDMKLDCGSAGPAPHFAGCELVTVFELPPRAVAGNAMIARVACEVALRWTGVSGRSHRQLARESVQVPVDRGPVESSVTLRYDFREAATDALVDAQRCGLVRD